MTSRVSAAALPRGCRGARRRGARHGSPGLSEPAGVRDRHRRAHMCENRAMRASIASAGIVVALGAGCFGLFKERRTYEDEGAACAMMADGLNWDMPQELEADAPITVQ